MRSRPITIVNVSIGFELTQVLKLVDLLLRQPCIHPELKLLDFILHHFDLVTHSHSPPRSIRGRLAHRGGLICESDSTFRPLLSINVLDLYVEWEALSIVQNHALLFLNPLGRYLGSLYLVVLWLNSILNINEIINEFAIVQESRPYLECQQVDLSIVHVQLRFWLAGRLL